MRRLTFMVTCFCSVSLTIAQIQPVVTGNQGDGSIDWSQSYSGNRNWCTNHHCLKLLNAGSYTCCSTDCVRNALETIKEFILIQYYRKNFIGK